MEPDVNTKVRQRSVIEYTCSRQVNILPLLFMKNSKLCTVTKPWIEALYKDGFNVSKMAILKS